MSKHSYHGHHAMHSALHLSEELKALPEEKDPMTAALCGFFAGGIGLGLYFKSWPDFFLPVMLWAICGPMVVPTGGMSIFFAAIFCATYGYRRAKASNEKLKQMVEERGDVQTQSQSTPPQAGRA